MSSIIIVDGNSLMFRAYFATSYTGNLMKTSTGLYTNAVFGFINMISKLLENKPDYVFVAFDAGKKTFRHQSYAEYKGGRKPMPDEFRVQIPYIKRYLDVIGIKHDEMLDFEADDLVASVSKLALDNKIEDIMVVSGDKDLLQLVRGNVKVCLTKKGITELEEYTVDNFHDKMGFNPEQIPDYKGLVGDSSDNLPGIKGIGEKTALKLLDQFKTLETIVTNTSLITGKTRTTIEEGASTGLTCKKLATLVYDIPLAYNLEDLKVKNREVEPLKAFYQELEFKSFITKLEGTSKTNSQNSEKSNTSEKQGQKRQINIALEKQSSNFDYTSYLGEKVAIIGEIYSENYFKGEFLGLCIMKINQNQNESENTQEFITKEELLKNKSLIKLLEENEFFITYDYKRTYVALKKLGINLHKPSFDLLLAIYLLDSRKGKDDFKETIVDYNEYELSSIEDIYGKGAKMVIPEMDILAQYAATKAIILKELEEKIQNEINQEELQTLFECEISLSKVLGNMELTGLIVSKNKLQEANKELDTKRIEYEKRIYELAGCEFNINSPKQLGEILFERLGLEGGKKNKNGYSTDASTLEFLAKKNEIAQVILQYRKVTKIISTYINGLFSEMEDKDSIFDSFIHPLYKQALTVTGRLSSVEPNIQNMPIRDDVGKVIREAFISRFDQGKIVSLDYSQIELRVLSSMANDAKMIEAFNSNVDFHRATASWIFDKDPSEITDHERSSAKAINFGIVYGMSAWGLSESIGISPKDAKIYIEKYFENYPGIDAFIKNTINQAKIDGFTKTYYGRKRYIPELKSMNRTIYQFGERTAVNSPIQGTAADIIKFAMVQVGEFLEKNHFKSQLIAQVHDELLFDCVPEEIDALIKGVKEAMENVIQLSVQLIASSSVGDNWMEA